MTKELLADKLNGREYRDEMTHEEEIEAKQHGLLVVFGASDDLMEFRGVIYDEIGAYEGATGCVFKNMSGNWDVKSGDEIDRLLEEVRDAGIPLTLPTHSIIAEWSPETPDCSWVIKTDLPHCTFNIMEDGELYCIGLVIDMNSIN